MMLDHAKAMRPVAAMLAALALSGCGAVVPPPVSAPPPPRFMPATPQPANNVAPPRNAGLVMGADARTLTRLLARTVVSETTTETAPRMIEGTTVERPQRGASIATSNGSGSRVHGEVFDSQRQAHANGL